MTKFSAERLGMARKWERHVSTKWRVVGKVLVVTGVVTVVMLTVVWSQQLYPTIIDAESAFRAILNEHAEFGGSDAWKDFAFLDTEEGTDMFMAYLWEATNPARIALDGVKPVLTEKGPYAYSKKVFRYEVRWPDDSANLTFKEWHYLKRVKGKDACRLMYFRQGKAEYRPHDVEVPPGCADPEELVTVLNPKYVRMLAQKSAEGLVASTSRLFLEKIDEALTEHDNFPRSVKSELIPETYEAVWTYRRAVHASTVAELAFLQAAGGSSTTASMGSFFAGDADAETFYYSNGRLMLSPGASASAGTGRWIKEAASGLPTNATLSIAEAALIFDPSLPWGPLNFTTGVPLWIGAGRRLTYVETSALENQDDAPRLARAYLINATVQLTSRSFVESEAVVDGVAAYLYKGWMPSPAVTSAVSAEWAGVEAFFRQGGCDAGGYDIERAPRVVSAMSKYYAYECPRRLDNETREFYAYNLTRAPALNATTARRIFDRAQRDTSNLLGMHHDENLINWALAYEYCEARKFNKPTQCAGMSAQREAALRTLPALVLGVDEDFSGEETASFLTFSANATMRARAQVCSVAAMMFGATAANTPSIVESAWHEYAVAAYLDSETGGIHGFSTALEVSTSELDATLGYAQWAGGYVTRVLWGVPSVMNIRRLGYWRFYEASYSEDLLEFHAHAWAIGYENMNISAAEGRVLLRALKSKSAPAEAFRKALVRVSTEYRCDGTLDFNVRDDTLLDDDPALSGTCDPFGSYCDCQEGGRYFYPQNAYANFTEALVDARRTASSYDGTSSSDAVIQGLLEPAAKLLDATFQSSPGQCLRIQERFRECRFLENEPNYKVWVTNCETWETTISDGTWGIFCDQETILRVDTPYDHSFRTVTEHPYPRKRGNVVASWLQQWSWRRILVEGRVFCDSGSLQDCDYSRGGLFVTHSAERVLFDGYVDRWALLLLNEQLSEYNLTASCANQTVVALSETCEPIHNVDCSDDRGLLIESSGPNATFTEIGRVGPRKVDWFSRQLALNLTNLSNPVRGHVFTSSSSSSSSGEESANDVLIVDNPAYAVFPGKTWEPETTFGGGATGDSLDDDDDEAATFHRKTDCEHSVFGGAPKFETGCDVTVDTGKRDLDDVGRVLTWYGNDTLRALPKNRGDAEFRVAEGVLATHPQTEPYGFEGYRWYNMSYRFRDRGLQFEGNASVYLSDPDALVVHALDRQGRGDLDIGMADGSTEYYFEWPTRREYDPDNYTRKVWVRANRFETTRRTFDAARRRAGAKLRDSHGEVYAVPVGFSSLEALADAPLFVSLPQFYGNAEWGGFEYLQVNFESDLDRRKHSYYVDIEPVSGIAVRSARRYQLNARLERDALYPDLVSSQERCQLPTADFNANGFGCFVYFPFFWISEERVLDGTRARKLKDQVLDLPLQVFFTAIYGLVAGVALVILGAVPWLLTHSREQAFKRRIYVD